MHLFECSKCHVVDNTALTNFWFESLRDRKPALCSECDPLIGKWHGEFPRRSMEEYVASHGRESVMFPDGYLKNGEAT